jgi:hypothetical protein
MTLKPKSPDFRAIYGVEINAERDYGVARYIRVGKRILDSTSQPIFAISVKVCFDIETEKVTTNIYNI